MNGLPKNAPLKTALVKTSAPVFSIFSVFPSRFIRLPALCFLLCFLLSILFPVNGPFAVDTAHSEPQLLWHTYLGGIYSEAPGPIAVGPNGNVYVGGRCHGSWGNPLRPFSDIPPADPHEPGKTDAFIAKIAADGSFLWHTYLGTAGFDSTRDIAVDGNGNIYVAGNSLYNWGSPIIPYGGGSDGFVVKLGPDGQILWHVFLGGYQDDGLAAVKIDHEGNIVVVGISALPWGAPVNDHLGGFYDMFIARLSPDGALLWSTFLGALGRYFPQDFDIDGMGNVYITGASEGTWGQPLSLFSGKSDAFAMKVDNNGQILWNTFAGDGDVDYGRSIRADENGNAYLLIDSRKEDYVSSWPPQTPVEDGILVKLAPNGNRLWKRYVSNGEAYFSINAGGLALDGRGNVYVGGTWDVDYRSCLHAFAACYAPDGIRTWIKNVGPPPVAWGTYASVWGTDITLAGETTLYITGFNNDLTDFGGALNLPSGMNDIFVAKLQLPFPTQSKKHRLPHLK